MRPLTVLVTNHVLAGRSGTEIVARDLALGLKARGHTPVVYTPQLGSLADELLARTVPVTDDLARVAAVPDVIHGHHTLETVQALLRFPGTPAVFVCHDWSAWHDEAPRSPLVRQYLAVDEACRDRLVCRDGVPSHLVRVLPNAVDLARFRRRPPLPPAPRRAAVFSNTASDADVLPAIAEGCRRAGVSLDRLGGPVRVANPEDRLPDYDLVFARGRSALEAMATGAAVVLADVFGFGGLVTRGRAEELRRVNFGRRALVDTPVTADRVEDAIRRYDPADATAVTDYVRGVAGLDDWLDRVIDLYREVLRTPVTAGERDSLYRLAADAVEVAMPYTRRGRERWAELDRDRATVEQTRQAVAEAEARCLALAAEAERREQGCRAEAEAARAAAEAAVRDATAALHKAETEGVTRSDEAARLREALAGARLTVAALRREVAALRASLSVRLGERVRRVPLVGRLLRRIRPSR